MQMMVDIGGAGLGGYAVKVSFGTIAYVYLRDSPDEDAIGLKIADRFSLGGSGPNIVVSAVRTKWFSVVKSEYDWLFDTQDLIGKHCDLSLSGSTALNDGSTVDLKWVISDKNHEVLHTMKKIHIPVHSESFQIGSTSIEGKIKRAQPQEHLIGADFSKAQGGE